MRNILLDTGAIVGLLRPADRHHGTAKSFFASLRPTDTLLTTWPVITECAFIMRRQEATYWDWLLGSEIQVADCGLDDLPSMREWRNRYEDVKSISLIRRWYGSLTDAVPTSLQLLTLTILRPTAFRMGSPSRY
jgi:predicted nucleic acid-binding protein